MTIHIGELIQKEVEALCPLIIIKPGKKKNHL